MKEQNSTRLRFNYVGKPYTIIIDSIRRTKALIANKIKIGHASYWLIHQNQTWQFIGDMPLCWELKNIIVCKIAAWNKMPENSETSVIAGHESVKTGKLLNTLLYVISLKKESHD